jgi:photosystem II stability/assembly factor-like uncharacterized protein
MKPCILLGKSIIILVMLSMIGCEDSSINYGPDFPFNVLNQSSMKFDSWEITSTKYEYPLRARDIFFINNDTGFLVGDYGHIYKTVDSGANWKNIASGVSQNLVSIFFLNDKIGYASSEGKYCPTHLCEKSCFLLKTIDGGETWTSIPFTDYYSIVSPRFFDESHGVALIYTDWKRDSIPAKFAITIDGGENWNISDLRILAGRERIFLSGNMIFVPGYHQQLYRSNDWGLKWDTIKAPFIQDSFINGFYFINQDIGFVNLATAVLTETFRTTDGGRTWSEAHVPFPYIDDQIIFFNENEGFRIAGFTGDLKGSTVYLTNDAGTSWQTETLREFISMHHTHFPNSSSGFGFYRDTFYSFKRQ